VKLARPLVLETLAAIYVKLDTLARTVVRACFSVIAAWVVLSACGLGTEGLGIRLPDDASTPEGSIDPALSDGPALADGSSFERNT
jgi:hypothetical protein